MVELKTAVMFAVLVPIAIWISLTIYNDLYSDTNTAVTTLNATQTTAGYSTAGNFTMTMWKIAQYGFVLFLLAIFGLAVIFKGVGRIGGK